MNSVVTPEWIAERVRKQLHGLRCFYVRFDNSKRHGRRPVQRFAALGVVFPSGSVAIETDDLERKGYDSMTDLIEDLSQHGKVEVKELGEVGA